jgi:hypothetical protein
MDSYQSQATFYRAALLLGLVSGEHVVEWAARMLELDPAPPPELIDLALIPPTDLSALRSALQPLAAERESGSFVAALLDLARGDLQAGRRSMRDTVTVLRQIRGFLRVGPSLDAQLGTLTNDHMLAEAGVTNEIEQAGGRIGEWLSQFAGAARPFLAPPLYHVLHFDRSAEAAAFVAALSRVAASPRLPSGTAPFDQVEIRAAPVGDGSVTVYLSDAALRTAQVVFSPVPVAGVCAAERLPAEARIVFDAASTGAMGVAEAELALSEAFT